MPLGTLPYGVCPSIDPSPVMTTSAHAHASRACSKSSTNSMPGRMVALNRPSMPPPVPPAAPAPGLSVILRPFSAVMASASLAKPQSSNATCSGFAPFCGANTAAAPSVPVRGLVTSHAKSERRQRIAVGGGDALDAARRSQLDHRGARILSIVRCSETALAKESISCDDRPAQRVMRVLRSQFAAGCLDQRVGQSLAAIGQRHHAAFGAGIAGRHAPAYRLSHGLRGSGFLERIRCQQIPHGQR